MAKAESRKQRKTPIELQIGDEKFRFLAGQLTAYEHTRHYRRAVDAERREER